MTPTLSTRFVAHLSVDVGEPVALGDTPEGRRRLVPILGGHVQGPELSGRVVVGGVDIQVQRTETRTEVDATYAIETDDGDTVFVRNGGIRVASVEDTVSLSHGVPVPAERVYFRTAPHLSTTSGRLAWINDRTFVGRGERFPATVELDVFVVE